MKPLKRKTIEISAVEIGQRFRKDLGDIGKLQKSIEEIGLLHPIVIDENNKLIAGRRRLEACKLLGWKTIPFTKINIDQIVTGEFHENSVRKDFTASEVAAIIEVISKHAKRPGRPAKEKGGKLPQFEGKIRETVSKFTNYSPRTIQKIVDINKAAKENPTKYKQILERTNVPTDTKKTLSINSAHKLVTRETRNLPKVPLPKKISDIFVVDVPIGFNDSGVRGAAEHHYPTMSPEELAAEKIPAADNAAIFFWMSPSIAYDTVPVKGLLVHEGSVTLQIPVYEYILHNWGFKVKAEFVWIKDKFGNGNYNRNQHENLFFAVKGKMPVPAKLFSSVINEIRTSHSKKPNIWPLVKQMYPKRNYCELYAREKTPGVRVHGNQLKEAFTA